MVPHCVPEVLQELKIMALRIERWTRSWQQEGQPYIPVSDYPRLSVCTTSCHDTSSLRGLWQEPDFDRELYWKHLGHDSAPPSDLHPSAIQEILAHLFRANSLLAILPLQDYLALGERWVPANPEHERINIPGTVGPHNWTWRIPCTLEELNEAQELNQSVLDLVNERKSRSIWSV